MLERVYGPSALNIAIQDGADAGQSVPHVHAHIIPRQRADLKERGGKDAIYVMLESEEGNIGSQLQERVVAKEKFPAVDADENRIPRSEEEMRAEAEFLSQEMNKDNGIPESSPAILPGINQS